MAAYVERFGEHWVASEAEDAADDASEDTDA